MLGKLFAAFRPRQRAQPGADAAQERYTEGLVHLRDGRVDAARAAFDAAHRWLPAAPAPLGMLGFCGWFDGATLAARRDYDRAIAAALAQGDAVEAGLLRINRLIDTLPQIAASAAQLSGERAWFERELDALLAAPPRIDDPLSAIHRTVFYLGYQGLNDRDINAKLARLFLRCTPSLGYVAAHAAVSASKERAKEIAAGARPRIGFVSMNLNQHSVGAWYNHFVRILITGGRFDSVLFTYLDQVDAALQAAADAHGHHVFLQRTLERARAQIEAERLDVLIYTDVGMHPFPYFLAFGRLARVQALLVGHPCTSGIPAIDWFISNVHQDHADAAAHYSESVARLPLIPVWVAKTGPPAAPMSRAALGWNAQSHYYVCPMMLQKMHPDFDSALGEILRRDVRAEIVLFADREHPLWQDQLQQRFEAVMPDVAQRIGFRRFAPKEAFLSLLQEADCVLDPFHFSGGVTTYVALSLGVPVVTLPGALFRSRMTAGIYAQAGVEGCVARSPEHFVELALGLAADPVWRAALGERIVAAHGKVFEGDAAVEVFADWLAATAATATSATAATAATALNPEGS